MERMYATAAAARRRPRWQYTQAAPTPRILHLPRRPRTKLAKGPPAKPTSQKDRRGRLETLFDQERSFARGVPAPVVVLSSVDQFSEDRRRDRVEEREERACGMVDVEEEKWRFQAEMLRAECNLLRMEKEIAVKKMERRRVQIERILRYAVQTLLSGRKKISEGKNVSMVLEQEINCLVEKLEKLQRSPRAKELEVKNCSNFDKQASFLQRRLEKFGGMSDVICVKEIQEMAEASLSIRTSCQVYQSFVSNSDSNMEILRRKMEGLSNGILLERMEKEYGSMLSTADSSVSSSKQIEVLDMPVRQPYKGTMAHEEKVCSGHCKTIVKRILEQVRAETEQWSQMQEMLGQVRGEMEELQASRDFWEDRALDSDCQMQSLRSAVQEWRQKAFSSEAKANQLQTEVSMLHLELERLRKDLNSLSRAKHLSSLAREAQTETEKRVLVCRLKENHENNDDGCKQWEAISDRRRNTQAGNTGILPPRRSPLQDIGNVSPLMRHNNKAISPLHCSYREDNF